MSGHSKWATIKHQKSVTDKKRGQTFSKLTKAISIAAREGTDPEKNFKLRLSIEKARAANMPKANIERALSSAEGKLSNKSLEEVLYEGYGPSQAAVLVEAVTDNRNRTTSEVKFLFEKSGGSLGGPGSVVFLFLRLGLIILKKPENVEEAILSIIDLEIENVEETERGVEVLVKPEQMEKISLKLEEQGFSVTGKDLLWQPKTPVKVAEKEKGNKVSSFMEKLVDHDDVQKVFSNFKLVG
ncbi:YebC/PmpR family DNA-binding transcriptional regulator [Patescibacteria group bacterium]